MKNFLNSKAIPEIQNFVFRRHKQPGSVSEDDLLALASDAQFLLDDGKFPSIALAASQTKSGKPEILVLPDTCVFTDED